MEKGYLDIENFHYPDETFLQEVGALIKKHSTDFKGAYLVPHGGAARDQIIVEYEGKDLDEIFDKARNHFDEHGLPRITFTAMRLIPIDRIKIKT